MPLSDTAIRNAKPGDKAKKMFDGGGLYLEVAPSGGRWWRCWIVDNDTFNSGAPGIGLAVADWLVSKNVALVGSDTWPVEVVPNPDPNLAFPVHQKFMTDNGIFLHENLDLEDLAADRVYKFAYIFVRVPFKGATGSPGSPIAIN
jgi:kynurenine formamidase